MSLYRQKNTWLIWATIAVVLIIAVCLLAPRPPQISENTNIVLTSEGWRPLQLVIKKGTEVTFSSELDRPFWPASDLHPTHSIYPDFDPREPVAATSSWSFTFDTPGVWKFHDHMASRFTGEVIVLDGEGKIIRETCSERAQTPTCFEQRLKTALKNRGLNAALELMAQLYADSSVFRASCHSYSHILGAEAFDLFEDGRLEKLSGKVSYCGYGFFHGFMEKMLQTSGNVAEAQDFCKKVGELLAKETSDAEGACYHGIGHGSVDGSDPTAWGDARAMIEPSIRLCERVAPINDFQGKRYRCVTGVYNSIEILSQDPKYSLSEISQHPFRFCATQPTEYQEGCYTNMLPALLRTVSFSGAMKEVLEIPLGTVERPIRSHVLLSLMHEYVQRNLEKIDFPDSGVSMCRSVPENMRISCFEGISGGLMKYGKPAEEYVRALNFCLFPLLKADESEACYHYILSRLSIWYSKEKIEKICSTVDSRYARFCQNI
jgi:hypothetical protein